MDQPAQAPAWPHDTGRSRPRGGPGGRRDVVVHVDAAGRTNHALAWAVDEADRRGTGLHILYAFELAVSMIANDLVSTTDVTAAAQRVCAAATARVQARRPGVPVTSEVRVVRPVPALVDASRHAAVVVVGIRGRGAGELGSTARELAARAHGPVVVVRAPARASVGPVVVGVDRHSRSGAAMDYALADAARRDVPLLAVHAVHVGRVRSPAREVEHVARVVQARAERFPTVGVEFTPVDAGPVEALLAHSAGAGLLVVGSRGLGGLTARAHGSVSQAVLRRADCVVAVVR
ncbi:MAG: universal stress protein [Georgenia sp.]